MARAMRLKLGAQYTSWYGIDDSTKIQVEIDGTLCDLASVPPLAVPEEPEQIGSQIEGTKRGHESSLGTWTKVGPDAWVGPPDHYGKRSTVRWKDLSRRSLIGTPQPVQTKSEVEEPTGTGAVAKAYCSCCDGTFEWVRFKALKKGEPGWRCEGCGDRVWWKLLADRNAEVISKGV